MTSISNGFRLACLALTPVQLCRSRVTGASLAALAVVIITALQTFGHSFKYLHSPVKTGVTIALAIAIIGAIATVIVAGLNFVGANYGDNVHDAVFLFSIFDMIWGGLGLFFTLSLEGQMTAFAENADPINPIATVISILDVGTGAAEAIASGG